MKTKISIVVSAIALIVFFNCASAFAQPGNPSLCRGASWTLSASATTVNNAAQVSIYANYQGDAGTCPFEGTITVNKNASLVSTNPSLPTNANIPACDGNPDFVCGVSGPMLVGTYTLTHSQGSAQQITFNITSITGGHTAGSGVTVTVNP